MMRWLRRLLGLCEHEWVTKFRGTATHGVQCRKCKKAELLFEFAQPSDNLGWVDEESE